MLLAFSVANFRSIKERQTLVLEATPDDALESSHVHVQNGLRVLRSAMVFGPNASGKSGLMDAMAAMQRFVLSSAREGQQLDEIPVEPFALHEATEQAPTTVEWEFAWRESRYRYGFVADAVTVHSEWLFRRRGGAKEARLFTRQKQDIQVNAEQFREGQVLAKLEKDLGNTPVRENALILSVCAQLNGQVSKEIIEWFSRVRFTSGLTDQEYFFYTAERLKDAASRQTLLSFAQRADFNISDLSSDIEETPVNSLATLLGKGGKLRMTPGGKFMQAEIRVAHPRFDKAGEAAGTVQFDLGKQESQGTQKFVALSGPLHRTVEEGSILIVDEFEARLHPLLTRGIFEWFHGAANRGSAQLIVATHDVGLMDPEFIRRDQVWFCDKDKQGATSLYCLAEFDANTVRPTTKFNRQYLLGLLGAVPKLALTREEPGE